MTMQLLITAIVLIVTALTVLLIVNSKLVSGPQRVDEVGNRNICIANKNTYCQQNPSACWNASEAIVKEISCAERLGKSEKGTLFNCKERTYYTSEEYDSILAGILEVSCGAEEM